MQVLGWHTPEGHHFFAATGRQREPSTYTASQCHETAYPYVLIMERGSASLWHAMATERIAKYEPATALSIFKRIVLQVKVLHEAGLVHCDIKPRNILVDSVELAVTLCDLDAAVPIGQLRGRELKSSTAYCPPEHMQAHIAGQLPGGTYTLEAKASFDVWSLGVVLFEMLAGRHLFPQDLSDDCMVDAADRTRLCVWLVPPDDLLQSILPDSACAKGEGGGGAGGAGGGGDGGGAGAIVRADAWHLVRWCLQGDEALRPTLPQILAHPLLGGQGEAEMGVAGSTAAESTEDGDFELVQAEEPVIVRGSGRMRFHMFISHMQSEASGDVGTLYFMLGQLGLSCWRDMNTAEITEAAMRQGVYDSDIFVLFLTNSVLSRYFCLKEISWALEFGKPIFMIVETEDRFWSWDYDRWIQDRCLKAVCKRTGAGIWRPAPLQNKFQQVLAHYPSVFELIKAHHTGGLMMPFRRRDFEVNALVRELIRRAALSEGIVWGRHLPPSPAEVNAAITRRICITAAIPPAEQLVTQLTVSLQTLSPNLHITTSLDEASHVLFLLTEGVMSCSTTHLVDETPSEAGLVRCAPCYFLLIFFIYCIVIHSPHSCACKENREFMLSSFHSRLVCLVKCRAMELGLPIVFAYSTAHGWDFNRFYQSDESTVCVHVLGGRGFSCFTGIFHVLCGITQAPIRFHTFTFIPQVFY